MKIKAKFYPHVDISDLEHGTITFCSWQRLEPYLKQAFSIKGNERLVGIVADESGVKGKIEYVDGSTNVRELPKQITL